METPQTSNVLPLPRWTIIIHAVQLLFAVVILGLDAYGIRWIPYNALIFSLVAALLTMLFTVYIIGTTLFLHKLYHAYIVLGLHALMIIFWIVDLGLVANLARIWSSPHCYYYYAYGYATYYCNHTKRDLGAVHKRDTTTVKAYYGALAAGAFFGGLEFATWVLSAVIVILYINKKGASNNSPSHAPPAYVGSGNDQAVPLEQKYGAPAPSQPQPTYNTHPQQPYSATQTPQPQYAQPIPQPYSDPVNRGQTVSPVSQAGYSTAPSELANPHHTGAYHTNVPELSSPQHTGGYHPTASELSGGK